MFARTESDGVVTLRLAHGKASAFDLELMEGMRGELAAIVSGGARALIITGTGNIFSAGVDLFRLTRNGKEYVRRFVPALTSMLTDVFHLPIPVVAAVNGHAIAGGIILTAAADYRIMAQGGGRIGAPELLVGVPFPAIALETLRFALANEHLQELIYTGRTVPPDEALAKGIIDEVVAADLLLERAHEKARQFAAIPQEAFRMTKRQLRGPVADRVLQYAAADEVAQDIWADPSTHEHIRSYLERTIRRGQQET